MTQQEFIGDRSVYALKNILKKEKPRRIFLVSGNHSYLKCGAKSIMDSLLKKYSVVYFSDFKTNPELNDIEKGIKLYKKNKCDFVIAVGGGSVMDIAKTINILANQKHSPKDYILKKREILKKGEKLAAIPTTAGSGSESTKFAVVYIKNTKYSLEHEFILPNMAIVDPQFVTSLPKYTLASSGIDAFCQSIESYWSVNSTTESRLYSKKSMGLILKNFENFYNNPDSKSKIAMVKASHLAGKAINISKTTLPHALSYYLTSHFGIPHGHAAALTLGNTLIYNYGATSNELMDKRGEKYNKNNMAKLLKILKSRTPFEAKNKIKYLMNNVGLETNLSKIGFKKKNIYGIIRNINIERAKNNPRRITKEGIKKILLDSL